MDDEPTGGVDTEKSVNVGGSVTGEIEIEGDIDYIAVELEAGVTYQFDLEGQYTNSGTLVDPLLLGIFNGSNIRLAAPDDDGGVATNSRIIFTPTVSGTYYVAASHYDNLGSVDTGTYTLYVNQQDLADRPDPTPLEAVSASGNDLIDGLTASQAYSDLGTGTTEITYSYPTSTSLFVQEFNLDEEGPDLTLTNIAASTQAVSIFETGLGQIEQVANINFTFIEEAGIEFGILRLSGNTAEAGNTLGIAGLPNRFPSGGDIYLFESFIGTGGRLTFVTLHELGHALGLTHTQEGTFPTNFDGAEYTLMTPSFQSAFFENATSADLYPTSFAYADILAFRHLYGGDDISSAGNNTYIFDLGSRYWETIFDLGGTDTIQITGTGGSVEIDLTPDSNSLNGAWINVGTTITYKSGGFAVGSRDDTVFISPETVIENVYAAGGNDQITGNSANNRLRGNNGADSLNGADGNDTLRGDDGNDVLYGAAGNDQLWAGSTDTGNDTVIGGAGDDIAAGGAGDDLLVGGGFEEGASAQLLNNVAGDSTDDGSDVLYGGTGNDTLIGGAWNDGAVNDNGTYDAGEEVTDGTDSNALWAGEGNDQIFGAAGTDRIGGGNGDDTVEAGAGDDTIYGGADSNDTGINDIINGGDGADVIFAGSGNDSIDGGNGDDVVFGGAGSDTITGGAGDDDIFAGGDSDIVTGGTGNDTLWGGNGDDSFTGGDGADTFVFAATGADTVTDLDPAEDVLRLVNTITDFITAVDVEAAATEQDGGLLIDLGGGNSVFLDGVSLSDVASMNLVL